MVRRRIQGGERQQRGAAGGRRVRTLPPQLGDDRVGSAAPVSPPSDIDIATTPAISG
jgi:hypothetical protein